MSMTILVPLDGSPAAERALAVPAALAGQTAVRAVLAQVVDRTDFPTSPEGAAAYLEGHAATLRRQGVPTTAVVLCGHAAAALVAEARRQAADLLVMISHDRDGLDARLFRSVPADVLAAAPAPLLLLHAAPEVPAPDFSP